MAQVIRVGQWASLGPPKWLLLPPEGGILGRGQGCDLRLNDPAVSHHHAEVGLDQNGLFIRDLDSRHGLYLDGRRIQEAYLKEGHTLRLAGHTLRFFVQEVEQAVAAELEELLLRMYASGTVDTGAVLARAWSRAAPKKSASQRMLAWFLLALGLSNEAKEAVLHSVWLAPNHPGTWFAQALLAEKQGRLDDALGYINKVINADPAHIPAQQALARLKRKQEIYGKVARMVAARKGGGATAPRQQEAQLKVGQFSFYYTTGLHDGLVSVAYAALAQAAEHINARLNCQPAGVRVSIKARLSQKNGLDAAAVYDGEIKLDAGHLADDDPNFLYVALAHEYVHLAVDRITGGSCPRWLDEGLAQFLTQNQAPADRRILARARAERALLPLEALEGDFAALELPALINLAYSQSYSLVEYMISSLGIKGINRILAGLAESQSLAAILKGQGLDMAKLESDWQSWLN